MANYKFDQFNIEIKNPSIEVNKVLDNYNGTASVEILMSQGNVNNKSMIFGVLLEGFTYTDSWTKAQVEDWVNTKLIDYEV